MKVLYQIIVDNLTIFDNLISNMIALGIIGLISFSVAWFLVGNLYRERLFHGKKIGSFIHWSVRIIVFLVLHRIFMCVLWIWRWAVTIPSVLWYVLLFVIVTLVMIVLLCRKHRTKVVTKGQT